MFVVVVVFTKADMSMINLCYHLGSHHLLICEQIMNTKEGRVATPFLFCIVIVIKMPDKSLSHTQNDFYALEKLVHKLRFLKIKHYASTVGVYPCTAASVTFVCQLDG